MATSLLIVFPKTHRRMVPRGPQLHPHPRAFIRCKSTLKNAKDWPGKLFFYTQRLSNGIFKWSQMLPECSIAQGCALTTTAKLAPLTFS